MYENERGHATKFFPVLRFMRLDYLCWIIDYYICHYNR